MNISKFCSLPGWAESNSLLTFSSALFLIHLSEHLFSTLALITIQRYGHITVVTNTKADNCEKYKKIRKGNKYWLSAI